MKYIYSKPFSPMQKAQYFLEKKLGKHRGNEFIMDALIDSGEIGQFGLDMYYVAPINPKGGGLRDLEELALRHLHQNGLPINSDNMIAAARAIGDDFFSVTSSRDQSMQLEIDEGPLYQAPPDQGMLDEYAEAIQEGQGGLLERENWTQRYIESGFDPRM